MIHQTAVGAFTWHDPTWTSMPIAVPLFGGATVQIEVFGEQGDAEVLRADEVDALQRFLALPQEHRLAVVPHLWRYYQDVWEMVGPPDIPQLTDPSTVWSHVAPRSVSVEHDEEGTPYVVVEAECDWEIEHGLQLVLQEGDRWVRVSDYTGHLTDGRAFGKRSLDDWIGDPKKTLPVRGLEDRLSAPKDAKPPHESERRFSFRGLADILTGRNKGTP